MKEEERSRNKAVQMDNLRGLLGIRRMDNPACTSKAIVRSNEGKDEKTDEGVFRWLGRGERMENNRIAKRVYVVKCAGSFLVGRTERDGLIT